MQVRIAFTGLMSFLNVEGKNETMGDPGVIAVQTPHHSRISAESVSAEGAMNMDDSMHTAFIGYDKNHFQVEDVTDFKKLTKAPAGRYLDLTASLGVEAVEIFIAGHAPGKATADDSYKRKLVRKDWYWPEAKDQWNRDYVPLPGKKPSSAAVKAYMRFGNGTLSAGRISEVSWEFKDKNGATVLHDKFAEEVVYAFDQAEEVLVIEIRKLGAAGTDDPLRILRVSPIGQQDGRPWIFIGNNTIDDIAQAIKQVPTSSFTKDNKHFRFLNKVAASAETGPIPIPHKPDNGGGNGGGGENGGPCGPGSAND